MEDSVALSMLLDACQSLYGLQSLHVDCTSFSDDTRLKGASSGMVASDLDLVFRPMSLSLQQLLLHSLHLRYTSISLSKS